MALKKLFHGVDGDKILKMLSDDNSKKGTVHPDSNNEIYFDERKLENCYVHGADRKRKQSYVLTVYVDLSKHSHRRENRPGNPDTVIVTTIDPISVSIEEMNVRYGKAPKFKYKRIMRIQDIKQHLLSAAK